MCSSTPIVLHPVEAGRVGDQHPLAFGQDRVVGGVPGHRRAPRRPAPPSGAGAPTPPTPTAPPRRDSFARGSMRPRWCPAATPAGIRCTGSGAPSPPSVVGRHPSGSCASSPHHRCPAATPSPPHRRHHRSCLRVRVDHPARQDRPIRLEPLPGHHQPQLVQPAERRQIRAGEGSVEHVEVSWMVGVRTSILRRPRHLTPAPTRQRLPHGLPHPHLRRARKPGQVMPPGIQPLAVHATHQQESAKPEISRTPTTPDPESPTAPHTPAAGTPATPTTETAHKDRATLPTGSAPLAQKGCGPGDAAHGPVRRSPSSDALSWPMS